MDNLAFNQAIEPIMQELLALRREVAALRQEAGEAPTLEPLVIEIDAVRGELEALKAHRLDVPAWAAGVYRQGAVVQHFHGQYFEALADTAIEPGDGVAWRRLGTHGFRYRGLFIENVTYDDGDLVARDGAMMLRTAGAFTWLSMRGKDGKRGIPGRDGEQGAPGRAGEPGTRGADGANLVKLEAEGGVLFGVWSDGKRAPIALEATS